MSTEFVTDYLSIGGNRLTAASSWSRKSGALAFGADQNVAIWYPSNDDGREQSGIRELLTGHLDKVSAVAFLQTDGEGEDEVLVSGSADGNVIVWKHTHIHNGTESLPIWSKVAGIKAHEGAVNSIATLDGCEFFVTGGSNAEIKLWKFDGTDMTLITSIVPKPRYIPLALALGRFDATKAEDGLFVVAGGTKNDVYVYAVRDLVENMIVEHQATLRGHEGWIHSLAIKADRGTDLLLASASHDKYVRLWRFSTGSATNSTLGVDGSQSLSTEPALTAKVQTVSVGADKYSITFEALLLGHEDWVYSAAWNLSEGSDQLMTASADGSLAIWEPDPSSGIWISALKLGEISGQKGATTATGSAGGFWTALWSPDGSYVACLGRTGSWRLWQYDQSLQYWNQRTGVTGHTSSVNGISWPTSGEYLLSTSADQTTRLHSEWRRNGKRSWHEFSRPQIHGYDLNCVAAISSYQFASGADEKLLRVFDEPKDVAEMLHRLCGTKKPADTELSDTAAMPVLGLSNKAMTDGESTVTELGKQQEYMEPEVLDVPLINIAEPPTEDLLSRHTLWPEHEKLYGHGYEISGCSYSNQTGVLATSCKASSTDHAVVRMYDAQSWNEIKPPLVAHSLTINRIRSFFMPDSLFLSVGRDRQWAVFRQSETDKSWKLFQSNTKAHSRMILDAASSPIGGNPFFATAGRDKSVKLWSAEYVDDKTEYSSFIEKRVLKFDSATTAVDFTCDRSQAFAVLAIGEESGNLSIHFFDIHNDLALAKSIDIPREKCPTKTVNQLAWRPDSESYDKDSLGSQLAVAAVDGSLRIIRIDLERVCKTLV